MIKRVKPFYNELWIENLNEYLKRWDFWKEGALMELEEKVADHVGRKYAIATNSTTNSIFMCLYVWSKKYPKYKQVIIPNWGYPAAYKACKVLGLMPIFGDIEKWTLGMSEKEVLDCLGMDTLAVVHIENNGVIGNPDINSVLPSNVLYIEDSAPSILQENAGTFGDVAMFSFSPTKPFCSGEGSVIVTDNKELYDDLKKFRYIGEYTNLTTSLNFAMSSLLATYLLPQFDFMEEIIDTREWVHNEYKKHLDIFQEPLISTNRHGSIMYLSKKAEKISKKLTLYNIEHRYRYYPTFEDEIDLPVSCEVQREIIDLPMHHELTEQQIKYICDIVRRAEDE